MNKREAKTLHEQIGKTHNDVQTALYALDHEVETTRNVKRADAVAMIGDKLVEARDALDAAAALLRETYGIKPVAPGGKDG